MIFDYLIVGQGIAGTVLSYKLKQKGQSVILIDDHHKLSSSKVAAGLVNPITGRRYVKSWMIDDLIPESINTYNHLESELNIKVIHRGNIIRTIPNREAQLNWERIELDDSASKYIVDKPSLGAYEELIKPVFDYGELTQSFRVDMSTLLSHYRKRLQSKQQLLLEAFDFLSLTFDESIINYKGLKAKNIIFCEGYQAIKNPLFKYLPFQPAKGEAIVFTLDNFTAKKFLRHKHFIVPMGNGQFWSGGGYDWKQFDDVITEKFKKEWLIQMSEIIKLSPNIVKHMAGVRPAVKGRRPLIGNHPELKNAYIFNGMGTKGASLAPFWAEHFANHLVKGQEINKDVDIKRFSEFFN